MVRINVDAKVEECKTCEARKKKIRAVWACSSRLYGLVSCAQIAHARWKSFGIFQPWLRQIQTCEISGGLTPANPVFPSSLVLSHLRKPTKIDSILLVFPPENPSEHNAPHTLGQSNDSRLRFSTASRCVAIFRAGVPFSGKRGSAVVGASRVFRD